MSVQWQPFHSGQEMPPDAVPAGHDGSDGSPFFVARGSPEDGSGGLAPGKYGPNTGRGVLFAAGGQELYSGKYDLLVGNKESVKWVDQEGRVNPEGLNLVEGGHEADGRPLWVAHVLHEGGVYPGKAGLHLDGCNYGYGGKELTSSKYRVLVHV